MRDMGNTYSKKGKTRAKSAKHLIPFIDVEVYVNADERCSFSGISCLKGGRIVVADYLGQNVKFYDWKMLKLIDHLQLRSPPYEVCTSALDDKIVYVTVPYEHKILELELGEDNIELIKEIETEGRCYGISSYLGGIAVSLRIDDHIWQIEILDYRGNVIKVFKDDEHGRELFGFADYLITDIEGTKLYVTDGLKNAVYCFDLKKSTQISIKELYRYTDSHLKIPKSLVLDPKGNLYVVGCESCNVQKISSTGEKLGVILSHRDQIENPMGIAYDYNEKKLFVTEGSRKVMIFKDSNNSTNI